MDKLSKLCDLTDELHHITLLAINTKYEEIQNALAIVFETILQEVNKEFKKPEIKKEEENKQTEQKFDHWKYLEESQIKLPKF